MAGDHAARRSGERGANDDETAQDHDQRHVRQSVAVEVGSGPQPLLGKTVGEVDQHRTCQYARGVRAGLLLGQDVVERGPGDEAEDRVVDGQERDVLRQVALRSRVARISPSIASSSRSAANARESPSSAVKRIATHRSPFAASSDESAGRTKWKTTSIERTKSSIAGSVSRARSSSVRSL